MATYNITPKTVWLPGRGDITVNQLELRVSSYQLAVGAQAFYDLQRKTSTQIPAVKNDDGEIIEPARTETKVDSFGLNGNVDLPSADFSKWGTDDNFFATSIAKVLGVTIIP